MRSKDGGIHSKNQSKRIPSPAVAGPLPFDKGRFHVILSEAKNLARSGSNRKGDSSVAPLSQNDKNLGLYSLNPNLSKQTFILLTTLFIATLLYLCYTYINIYYL